MGGAEERVCVRSETIRQVTMPVHPSGGATRNTLLERVTRRYQKQFGGKSIWQQE
jgi:hypothetical protein